MPASAHHSVDAATLETRLRELATGANHESRQLPLLAGNESPLKDWYEQVADWFKHLANLFFPHTSYTPDESTIEFMNRVFRAIPYVLMIIALVLAAGFLIAWRRNRIDKKKLAAAPPPDFDLLSLVEAVRLASEREDWSAAARWRWRLFLARCNQPADVTPLEYRRSTDASWGQSELASVYRLMFAVDGNRDAFVAADALWRGREP